MELALQEMAVATTALERTEEVVALKQVNAAKAALESAEEKMASMNRIRAMVRETSLLEVETFSDDDVELVVDEWINKRKLMPFNVNVPSEQTMNHRKKASRQTIRKVCFVPENNVTVLIENRVDFSEKEIKQCWYSVAEVKQIKKVCYKNADQLESGDTKNRRLCSRGLETMTRQGQKSSLDAYHACVDAVMDEQDIQWSNDCENNDLLAMVSREVSKSSMEQAIKRAIKDERDARRIYRLGLQKLSSPTTPNKRKVSKVELSMFLGQSWDTKEPQDPGVGRSKEDNTIRCKSKDIRGPGRTVPMGSPLISIRANGV